MKLPFGLGKGTPREPSDTGTGAGQANDTNAATADAAATTVFPTSEGGRAEPQKVGAPRGRGRRSTRTDKTEATDTGTAAGAATTADAPHSMTSGTADPETTVLPEASTASGPQAEADAQDTATDRAASTPAAGAADAGADKPVTTSATHNESTDASGRSTAAAGAAGASGAAGAAVAAAGAGAGAMAAPDKPGDADSTTIDFADSAAHETDQDRMNPNSTEAFSTAGNDTTAFPAAGAGFGEDYTAAPYAYDDQLGPQEATPAAAAEAAPARRGTADFGRFALRVVVGAFLLLHALRIVFGTFNGPGTDAFGLILADSGFSDSSLLATVMGVAMLVGAVLLILGLATPLAAAVLLAVVALSALALIAAPGSFTLLGGSDLSGAPSGGLEIHVLYGVALFALLFTGGGRWGLDFSRKYATAPRFSGLIWLILAIAAVALVWYFLHGGNPLADASGAAAAQ